MDLCLPTRDGRKIRRRVGIRGIICLLIASGIDELGTAGIVEAVRQGGIVSLRTCIVTNGDEQVRRTVILKRLAEFKGVPLSCLEEHITAEIKVILRDWCIIVDTIVSGVCHVDVEVARHIALDRVEANAPYLACSMSEFTRGVHLLRQRILVGRTDW